jgi:hypothetical protein
MLSSELQAILPENVYNMDETGVMLCMLGSIKLLVGMDCPRDYRGAGVKWTMAAAIECISANRTSSLPMIFWPATTHRRNLTMFPHLQIELRLHYRDPY